MGKKKTKETESQNDESQTQSGGIFTTLFSGDVAEGESSGFSSLFSDENPFRRKQQPEIKDSISPDAKKGDKRNADAEKEVEEEETVLPVKTKKSKKGQKRKSPVSDSEAEEETNTEAIEESGLVSKRKKRKRDEIENEYETKKYGSVEEKKVGEKRKKADEVADTMVSKEGFDDESKLLRTVFVGNLPLKVKKKLILKEFSKFGEVESVRIRSVPIVDVSFL